MRHLLPAFEACWTSRYGNDVPKDCLVTSGASILALGPSAPPFEVILARLTLDYRWFSGNRSLERETWVAQGVIIDSTINALGRLAYRGTRRPPVNIMFPNNPPWAAERTNET
jgi:hypothetical protein